MSELNKVAFEEPHNCPICRRTFVRDNYDFVKRTSARDTETSLGVFEIWECVSCRVGLTCPRATTQTTHLLYETQDTSDFDMVRGSLVDWIKDAFALRLIRRISKNLRVENALDYGAGNGRYANAIRRAFPKAKCVMAADFSPTPPSAPRSYFGNDIEYTTYEQLALSGRRYDLILFRHVLEHVHDPQSLVRKIDGLLTDTGRIYVEVPNLDAGLAHLFGERYSAYYVPRHVLHFTRRSLVALLKSNGFKVVFGRNNMPLMGNMVAIYSGLEKSSLLAQLLGIFLYPVQVLVETLSGSSTCINFVAERVHANGRESRSADGATFLDV